ncbi:MAG: efflux RND transporter periplasmic adaptor subunit [Candidatus Azotimanducaceae bacterium]
MNKSQMTSVGIACGMAVWLFSGDFLSQNADAETVSVEMTPVMNLDTSVAVRGERSEAVPKPVMLDVLGQTKANRRVAVKSELTGRVTEVLVDRGAYVQAGDPLCRIGADSRVAELREAKAKLKSAEIEYQGGLDLSARGLQSKVALAKLAAQREQTLARVDSAAANLSKTELSAPFSGYIEDRPVEVGDLVTPGTSCAVVIELEPLLVVGQVAESEVANVFVGQDVGVAVGSASSDLLGKITFVARTPDPVTRSFKVEARIDQPGRAARAGLSATLSLPIREAWAHLVSPASLSLDVGGQLGLKVANSAGKAEFKTVEIVGEGPEGVWVAGLPQATTVITAGHEDVASGQSVTVDYSGLNLLSQN